MVAGHKLEAPSRQPGEILLQFRAAGSVCVALLLAGRRELLPPGFAAPGPKHMSKRAWGRTERPRGLHGQGTTVQAHVGRDRDGIP